MSPQSPPRHEPTGRRIFLNWCDHFQKRITDGHHRILDPELTDPRVLEIGIQPKDVEQILPSWLEVSGRQDDLS